MKNLFLITLALFLCTHSVSAQVIVTAVGGGIGGVLLHTPYGLAVDDSDNLYICDVPDRRVRKVSPGYGGIISTVAGNGTSGYSGDGGWATDAQLAGAIDVAVDHQGNVYIADGGDNCIRKVTTDGIITTIAGNGTPGYNGDGIAATAALLNIPTGIAVDDTGNIYIVDGENFRIRKIDTNGIITTIIGTGISGFSPDGSLADTAKLHPLGIRIYKNNIIFFTDNMRVRRMDSNHIITTVAGNGVAGYSGDTGMATAAKIEGTAIAIDTIGNIYLAEGSENRIRKVTVDGIINTIAGTGSYGFSGDYGNPLLAKLDAPFGVAVNNSMEVYISDAGNARVRLVSDRPLYTNNSFNALKSVNVYPTPSHGFCTIQVVSVNDQQYEATVTNIMGLEITRFTGITNRPYAIQPDWPPGLYIINATTATEHYSSKIIIQ